MWALNRYENDSPQAKLDMYMQKSLNSEIQAEFICFPCYVHRPSVITDQVLQLVERAMKSDDETTATRLHVLLTSCEIRISFSTILRSRSMLGWTFRGSKYCQLIRPRNQFKRLQWAVTNLPELLAGGFEDVIWTDETSVQLESHRRHSYQKKGEPVVLKPRPKHPVKLHVWAGISKKGRTSIVYHGCYSVH